MIMTELRRLTRNLAVFSMAALAGAGGVSVTDAAADQAVAQASSDATIIGLRQAGWVVTERTETIDRRPGLPPYEMKDRTILVTTFVLEKGGERKRCTLAYDSQLERFTEACRDVE